jgi:AcrR family transcriptional regulator
MVTEAAITSMPEKTVSRLGEVGSAAAPTRLSKRLTLERGSDSASPSGLNPDAHPDAIRAFGKARQLFLDGERIDMGNLATELDVDRTSLFRWVGNRDALLSEVLWSLAVPTLDRLDESVEAEGAERITRILTGFVDALITADYFRTFLRREPARALRLLTTKESEMQRRFVAVVESLLADETARGAIALPLALHEVAALLVRIVESFSYSDLITGEEPSSDRARAAFEFVLR